MKNFYCSLSGHQFEVTKNVTFHVKEYTCKHCKLQMTTNGKGGLSELTPKYQEINRVLGKIHNRRQVRNRLKIV